MEVKKLKKSEIAGHATAGIGQNLIFGIWSTYTLVFFTDIFGLSGGVAGGIILICRILDCIADPIMGGIADHTKSKWGRYRPWLLFMAIPTAFFLVLNFTTPDLTGNGKIIYAFIVYLLLSLFFTSIDVPYWTLPAVMSNNVEQRTKIYTTSRVTTTLAVAVSNVLFIPLAGWFGGANEQKGFQRTAIFIGILAVIFYFIGFKTVKEHIQPKKVEKFSFKNTAAVIIRNKPLLLALCSLIIVHSSNYLRNNMLVYYVQNNLGNISLVPLFTSLNLIAMIVGMFLATVLSKRIGIKKTFICACTIGTAISFLFFIIGYTNLPLVIGFYFLCMIPTGILTILISPLVANTIEYAEWKTGLRSEGIISSTQTFASKFSIGIGVGLCGVILSLIQYQPNIAQPAATLNMFQVAMSIIPAMGLLLAIVPMSFYELTEKRYAEIVEEVKNRAENNTSYED